MLVNTGAHVFKYVSLTRFDNGEVLSPSDVVGRF